MARKVFKAAYVLPMAAGHSYGELYTDIAIDKALLGYQREHGHIDYDSLVVTLRFTPTDILVDVDSEEEKVGA